MESARCEAWVTGVVSEFNGTAVSPFFLLPFRTVAPRPCPRLGAPGLVVQIRSGLDAAGAPRSSSWADVLCSFEPHLVTIKDDGDSHGL